MGAPGAIGHATEFDEAEGHHAQVDGLVVHVSSEDVEVVAVVKRVGRLPHAGGECIARCGLSEVS